MNVPEKLPQPTVITADCRKMSGADFWRMIHADRYAKRERDKQKAEEMRQAVAAGDTQKVADLLLEAVAEKVGMPFDELKQRTKNQWL